MIGPEVMRAFETWRQARVLACQGCEELSGLASRHTCSVYAFTRVGTDVYPLYIGAPHNGRWYVRERMPGTRVWRAEDDGGFTLLDRQYFRERLERIATTRGCPREAARPDALAGVLLGEERT